VVLKKPTLAVLFFSTVLVMTPSRSFAAYQDFVIENETGFNIARIYISPSNDNKWRLLRGEHTSSDGASTKINFSDDSDGEYWDLKVVYSNGSSHEWHALDLFAISKVVLCFQNERLIANQS
jgi:hypothetical protein